MTRIEIPAGSPIYARGLNDAQEAVVVLAGHSTDITYACVVDRDKGVVVLPENLPPGITVTISVPGFRAVWPRSPNSTTATRRFQRQHPEATASETPKEDAASYAINPLTWGIWKALFGGTPPYLQGAHA